MNRKLSLIVVILSCCIMVGCSETRVVKVKPLLFDYSAKMIMEKGPLGESSCYLSLTITNKNNHFVNLEDRLQVFMYDAMGNQVSDPQWFGLDASLEAGRSYTPRPNYVESGKLGRKICKSVVSYKYKLD